MRTCQPPAHQIVPALVQRPIAGVSLYLERHIHCVASSRVPAASHSNRAPNARKWTTGGGTAAFTRSYSPAVLRVSPSYGLRLLAMLIEACGASVDYNDIEDAELARAYG